MDAIKFLLGEHNKVKKLLGDLTKKTHSDAKKKKIFLKLTTLLPHHEKMEEKVWYPFLKKNMEIAPVIKHLVSEEKAAGNEIKKLKKIKSDEVLFEHFPEFKKAVLHHAGEEEKKLFPQVRKTIDKKDLAKIGKVMQEFKKELDAKIS